MKWKTDEKVNRFAKRALADFSDTLMEMLTRKPLESVMINELCEEAGYPRATFYNYFDDKYDLLNYCWTLMRAEIHLEDYREIAPEKRAFELFDRFYDFLDRNERQLRSILQRNGMDSEFVGNFRIFAKKQITDMMELEANTEQFVVPLRIIADHYCNTVIMLLEWCFLHEDSITREQAHSYMTYLLEGV